MKRYYTNVFLTLLFLFAGCSYNCEAQKHADKAKGSAASNDLHKLSPDLSSAYEHEAPGTPISVLVKTAGTLTPEQKKELMGQGIGIGTVVNDIFTADIQLKDVTVLTEKSYIKSVELSRKLKLLNK